MSDIAIVTDSVACIPQELARQLKIKVVPAANILVDGKSYIDGETISALEAYELIKEDPDRFVTSAVQPDYLLHTYEELSQQSKEILFITISSALSAVSRTAELAIQLSKDKLPNENIKIFDSKACASTQGLVVIAAAKAAAQGKRMDEVISLAQRVRDNASGIMMLDTLRYVYRTGRMSKTASRIASIFNIKPINRITDNGTLEMVDRTRKTSDGMERLVRIIARDRGDEPLHFMVTHAAAEEYARDLVEKLQRQFNCLSMIVSDYSPVMGYGAGPGALFIGYHPEIT